VRKFGADGVVTGEYRFLGLYTQAAYTESITRIPVLRQKLNRVLEAAGLPDDSHDGKELIEILEGYPREELFEISAEQLTPIALGVLRLGERKQVRLFLRPDAYGRYMSCLMYLPRDRYNHPGAAARPGGLALRAGTGASVDYSAMVSNSALARLHVVVQGQPGKRMPPVDAATAAELQARVAAAVRSWDEDVLEEAERRLGAGRAARLAELVGAGIPETYKADVRAGSAVTDLARVCELRAEGQPFALHLTIRDGREWRLRVYRSDSSITLSRVLPQLQHMGLEVMDEHPYEFGGAFWVYDFTLRRVSERAAGAGPPARACGEFEAALTALWNEQAEDDGFNALVLDAGLSWRQVVLLRAYARYLRQAGPAVQPGLPASGAARQPADHPAAGAAVRVPLQPGQAGRRGRALPGLAEELRGLLDEVTSLDHDRILRAYLALVEATLRTSYYQVSESGDAAPYLVLKLAPESVGAVPAPRPKFEIFVLLAPAGGGPPALRRGRPGRPALVRTARRLPHRSARAGQGAGSQELRHRAVRREGRLRLQAAARCQRREAFAAEVLGCYRAFIAGLLDVTDNIAGDAVVPPPRVIPPRR